jgi:hypothetical protein
MTNIPQDIIDDAVKAGFKLHLYKDGEEVNLTHCGYFSTSEIIKLCQIRDERQRSSGEVIYTEFQEAEGLDWMQVYNERERKDYEARGYKIRELFTTPQQPNIPEGWQLVPIEPTEEMVEAGDITQMARYSHCTSIYKAMLSAAPSAPDATQSQAVMDESMMPIGEVHDRDGVYVLMNSTDNEFRDGSVIYAKKSDMSKPHGMQNGIDTSYVPPDTQAKDGE